jgi:hypothetical protein
MTEAVVRRWTKWWMTAAASQLAMEMLFFGKVRHSCMANGAAQSGMTVVSAVVHGPDCDGIGPHPVLISAGVW